MINESKVMSKGGKAFESIGLICDVEPKASNRFDKKYTINININEMITVLVNLSFWLRLITKDDESKTSEAIKNGRNISP